MDPAVLESIRRGSIRGKLRSVGPPGNGPPPPPLQSSLQQQQPPQNDRDRMLASIRRGSTRAKLRPVVRPSVAKSAMGDGQKLEELVDKSDSDGSWKSDGDDDDEMDGEDMAKRMQNFKLLVRGLTEITLKPGAPEKRGDVPTRKFLDKSDSRPSIKEEDEGEGEGEGEGMDQIQQPTPQPAPQPASQPTPQPAPQPEANKGEAEAQPEKQEAPPQEAPPSALPGPPPPLPVKQKSPALKPTPAPSSSPSPSAFAMPAPKQAPIARASSASSSPGLFASAGSHESASSVPSLQLESMRPPQSPSRSGLARRAIPREVTDITPGWLSSQVGIRYDELAVQQVTKMIPSHTYHVTACSNLGADKDMFLIVKTPGPPTDGFGDAWTGTRECYFYERLSDEVTRRSFVDRRTSPLCVLPLVFSDSSLVKAKTKQGATRRIALACTGLLDVVKSNIVAEDGPGPGDGRDSVAMGDDEGEPRSPLLRAHNSNKLRNDKWSSLHSFGLNGVGMRAVVAAVAHLHSRYWNRTMVKEVKELPVGGMWGEAGWFEKAIGPFVADMKTVLSPLFEYIAQTIIQDFPFVLDVQNLAMAPQTLCHNNLSPDCVWVNGEDNSTKSLITDWDSVGPGCPGLDLAMLFSSSMTTHAREAWTTVLFKQYVRGLARNGVPASQRQQTHILDLFAVGVFLLVPKIVHVHACVRRLRKHLEDNGNPSLAAINNAVIKLKTKQLKAWTSRVVDLVDEMELQGALTKVMLALVHFKQSRVVPVPVPFNFDPYTATATVLRLTPSSWKQVEGLCLESSGWRHDAVVVQLGEGNVVVKFSQNTARELLGNRIGLAVLRNSVRVRALTRFSDEWRALTSHLHRVVGDHGDAVAQARMEGLRSYPVLLVCEHVCGGAGSNFEQFLAAHAGDNPFVAGRLIDQLSTPRGVNDQDVLTRVGWRLLFDIGVATAYSLMVNNYDSFPIAHVWEGGSPRQLFIDPSTNQLVVGGHAFWPPYDPHGTPANTPFLRCARQFLLDAFIPHLVPAPFASAVHRARMREVWMPTLEFLQDYLGLPALQHNYQALQVLSEGLKHGMQAACKLTQSDFRSHFTNTKTDLLPSLERRNTAGLGPYPLRLLKAATDMHATDLDYLGAMHALFHTFLDGGDQIREEVGSGTSELSAMPAQVTFNLPGHVAQSLMKPSPINKMLSLGKHHDRLVQLNEHGSKLVWLKPGDKGQPPKRKGYAPLRQITSLRLTVDLTARQILEIEWPEHLILLREHEADPQPFRTWVVCLPHLIRFNKGGNVDVELTNEFLECVADPRAFFGDQADAAVLARANNVQVPMSVGALSRLLDEEERRAGMLV